MKVLVTGATGALGRELVPQLQAAGHEVRMMSRVQRTGDAYVRADLRTDAGLADAVADVDCIMHAASATTRFWQYRSVDVAGTRRLLEVAEAARVEQFIYPSIVAMEGVPHPYYKSKLAVENIVSGSALNWSILRVTQFYSLVDQMIGLANRSPLVFLPKNWTVQPIAPADAAAEMIRAVSAGRSGRLPDIGGPQVRTFGDLTLSWMELHGSRRRVHNLPFPGRISRAFSSGQMTCPGHPVAGATWEQWLVQKTTTATTSTA